MALGDLGTIFTRSFLVLVSRGSLRCICLLYALQVGVDWHS